ncbi:MAG: rhodanese-like domain-containing protein [Myxococcota bacterium]
MLRRLINLPFAVAGKAAKAFQERDDKKTREKYGEARDPGEIGVASRAPEVDAADETARIDVADAKQRDVVYVDVRRSPEGGIAGAMHMPLDEVSVRVSELPPDRVVVAYCEDGRESARAVAFFRERGMEDTYWLGGGLGAWRAAR